MRRDLLLFTLLLVAPSLMGRELHWESIEVKARLDAAGSLQVVERQRFVFSGDWNGGERRFRVERGQGFQFKGISRIDQSGTSIPLISGDLSGVDQYGIDGYLLRWRSRLPTDPEFDNTLITYEIEYVLTGILAAVRSGDRRYLLNHDFAFADRPGTIERFVLSLEFDPSWQAVDRLPTKITATNMRPGESLVVRRELAFTGSNAPRAEYQSASPIVRYLTIIIVLGGIPLIFVRFWLGESARGRFVRPAETIDQSWLEEHIFSELPEVIGYMYDNTSGPPEVAAILARMAQEGKITSSVEPRRFRAPLLRMTLHVGERDLSSQERHLVHLFFRGGSDETDTDEIRKRYKKTGFSPGARIEATLVALAASNRAWTNAAPGPKKQQQWRVLTGAFLFLIFGLFFGYFSGALMVYMAILGGLACWIGRTFATRSTEGRRSLPLWWFAASVPTLLLAWFLTNVAGREESHVKEIPFLIAAGFILTVYWFVMKAALTKESTEKMLLRARIRAARQWFLRQLRMRNPELRDEWAPYLLALGLGRNVDRWFSSFGGEVARLTSSVDSSFGSRSAFSSTPSESVSGPSWSGGGGAFGGAGATGSWAVAATSLGSGSSAAMNMSSGGGSGGGSSSSGSSDSSSSSGGGGGGGW